MNSCCRASGGAPWMSSHLRLIGCIRCSPGGFAASGCGIDSARHSRRRSAPASWVVMAFLRGGILGGFMESGLNVTRDYVKLERQFLAFSCAIGVRASELDAVIWLEMMASPMTVRALLPAPLLGRTRAQKRRTHAGEAPLL